jgi:hypothetical protein
VKKSFFEVPFISIYAGDEQKAILILLEDITVHLNIFRFHTDVPSSLSPEWRHLPGI